jgi:hypothetical protein
MDLEIALRYIALILFIAGMWKVFVKAGWPGWAAIVPFYNMYVLTQAAARSTVWFVLMLIPCVSVVAWFVVCIGLARVFGKSIWFGLLLALFSFIFFPILGYGRATYQGLPDTSPPEPEPDVWRQTDTR